MTYVKLCKCNTLLARHWGKSAREKIHFIRNVEVANILIGREIWTVGIMVRIKVATSGPRRKEPYFIHATGG